MSSPDFTFTFIVTIIISVFVPSWKWVSGIHFYIYCDNYSFSFCTVLKVGVRNLLLHLLWQLFWRHVFFNRLYLVYSICLTRRGYLFFLEYRSVNRIHTQRSHYHYWYLRSTKRYGSMLTCHSMMWWLTITIHQQYPSSKQDQEECWKRPSPP